MTCIQVTPFESSDQKHSISVFIEPCGAGEQPHSDNTTCMACPLNSYKTEADAIEEWRSECTPCTGDTQTVNEGSTEQEQCFGKYCLLFAD